MLAVKLRGQITNSHRLVIELPKDIAPGVVEVIILHQTTPPLLSKKRQRKVVHPGFGVWAKRKDIISTEAYAAELRRKIENREDGRQ